MSTQLYNADSNLEELLPILYEIWAIYSFIYCYIACNSPEKISAILEQMELCGILTTL